MVSLAVGYSKIGSVHVPTHAYGLVVIVETSNEFTDLRLFWCFLLISVITPIVKSSIVFLVLH